MTDPTPSITLAIEASIEGGSVALFNGSDRIDGTVESTGVSRAEDILPTIDRLLSRNDLNVGSLSDVIVGAGPGSFTGIRIGISTAMGIAAAVKIPVRRFSSLEALACAADTAGPLTVALPVGRGMVCVQEFNGNSGGVMPTTDPLPLTYEEFARLVSTQPLRTFVVSDSIFQRSDIRIRDEMINVGNDLASLFGRFAAKLTDIDTPLFIAKAK
ncbi:MAG: tRNA (adenosine(37)-N6)-threonylcarbamoyltransferase complex dimerization subunit type 1 TsaB [Acidobacteriota bacterium]